MSWARIVLVFEFFAALLKGTYSNGFSLLEISFLVHFVGNIRVIFLACNLNALGTNPAGVQFFRRYS